MNCRHCGTSLQHTLIDLGFAPPSNAYLTADDLRHPEVYYPLRVKVCHHCWLVQTEDYPKADELFRPDYAYFSSASASWLAHAAHYSRMIIAEFSLDSRCRVIEIAANDGYLLKNFVAAGIPCLGIEPTASTAATAEGKGIPILREFFGESLGLQLAAQGGQADLVIGNNVYAHVPDINDFTRGLKAALKPGGAITLEFPHLLRLIEQAQFDTIYHEHFSYLSLATVSRIFKEAGLRVWKVEELLTHGGSVRIYGCHAEDQRPADSSVARILAAEAEAGLQTIATYQGFQARADLIKDELLTFLIKQKRAGKKVAAYGAAAKGNTLLNYAGVKPDLLPYVCDAAASKQGKFLPGSHIPVVGEMAVIERQPDYLIVLPWNIQTEIENQLAYARKWGAKFVRVAPRLAVN